MQVLMKSLILVHPELDSKLVKRGTEKGYLKVYMNALSPEKPNSKAVIQINIQKAVTCVMAIRI